MGKVWLCDGMGMREMGGLGSDIYRDSAIVSVLLKTSRR